MSITTVLIMGAAGRDFHNVNVVFRDHPEYRVVAFTAAQIPNIAERRYPPELAGSLYPHDIPIHPEDELKSLIATPVDLGRIVSIKHPPCRVTYSLVEQGRPDLRDVLQGIILKAKKG